jgi:hypothetical protein
MYSGLISDLNPLYLACKEGSGRDPASLFFEALPTSAAFDLRTASKKFGF